MSRSKTKSTLIRIDETTKVLLDSVRRGDKGYSGTIEHLIHDFKKHARINVVTKYLMDDNVSEMDLLDSIDTYLHYHYKDDPEYEWLMPRLRKLIDEDQIEHGHMSKSEIDGA